MTNIIMFASQAEVTTDRAGRYLDQLCKHFAHKIPVTLAPGRGTITFSEGECDLTSNETLLTLKVSANTADAVKQLEDVVARHLARFAFREPPVIAWSPIP